jgi:hypothetical protein
MISSILAAFACSCLGGELPLPPVSDGVRIWPAEEQMANPTNPFLTPSQAPNQNEQQLQSTPLMPECHLSEPTEDSIETTEDSQGI